MSKCAVCGRDLSGLSRFSVYVRQYNGVNCCLCESCVKKFDSMTEEEKLNVAQTYEKTGENVFADSMTVGKTETFIGQTNGVGQVANRNSFNAENQRNNSRQGNFGRIKANRAVLNSATSLWISFLKIVGIIQLVGAVIAGLVIGSTLFSFSGGWFLGILLGLIGGGLVGIASVSILMMFIGMAEDIKELRNDIKEANNNNINLLGQITDLLEKINKSEKSEDK